MWRSETSKPWLPYPVRTASPDLDPRPTLLYFILSHGSLNCESYTANGSGHISSLKCQSDNFNFTVVLLTLFYFKLPTFSHSQEGVSRVSTPLFKCVAADWELLTQNIKCRSATTARSVFLPGYGLYSGTIWVNFYQGQWLAFCKPLWQAAWVPGLIVPEIKRSGRESNQSLAYCSEIKNTHCGTVTDWQQQCWLWQQRGYGTEHCS
jgi:hypothetical protein